MELITICGIYKICINIKYNTSKNFECDITAILLNFIKSNVYFI